MQRDPPPQNFALNTNIDTKQDAGAIQTSYTRKNKSNHFAPSILTVRHAPQRSDRGKTVRTHRNPGILGNPRSVAEDFGIFTVLRSKFQASGPRKHDERSESTELGWGVWLLLFMCVPTIGTRQL